MEHKQKLGITYACLAAAFYALNAPMSKLLLAEIPAAMMAALLYLGAGIGLFVMGCIRKLADKREKEHPLTRNELPFIIGMVVLDIAAPILLMAGLSLTTAANASLLNNFEIVATSLIALFAFGEKISKRLWLGIGLVTLSSAILSFEDSSSLSFSLGSALILLACVCWGLENNCTRKLSSKNPVQIVVIKGIFSGIGSLLIALSLGERITDVFSIVWALLLGFVAYGMSIYFYIYAQRVLGAAKTSAYYAVAPFIGVAMSLFLFHQVPDVYFVAALLVMAVGTWFVSTDTGC